MLFIAFLGCNGSGKSALNNGLKLRLEQDDRRVTLGHWRLKARDPSSNPSESVNGPRGQAPRGTMASNLKLVWLWLNWWVVWFLSLRAESRSGYVLFDSYHGDLLVDLRRYRYGGPMWIAKFMVAMMPQPDWVIFLDAAPKNLLVRKQEVGRDDLASSPNKYREVGAYLGNFKAVDASEALESVSTIVFREVS